jgi:hypothetical protein
MIHLQAGVRIDEGLHFIRTVIGGSGGKGDRIKKMEGDDREAGAGAHRFEGVRHR